MDVHQCAQFFNNPHLFHKHAVRRITKYFSSTYICVHLPYGNQRLSTHGIVYKPDKEKIMECYVNADFDSGLSQAEPIL